MTLSNYEIFRIRRPISKPADYSNGEQAMRTALLIRISSSRRRPGKRSKTFKTEEGLKLISFFIPMWVDLN